MTQGAVVRYPKGFLEVPAETPVPTRAKMDSPVRGNDDGPQNLSSGPNGTMARKLLDLKATLPKEIQANISYDQVEQCLIKGVIQLTKMACILRQVANRMQRTIMNSYSAPRSGSKRITKAQYQTCEKCKMWLSDEDYVAIRQRLGSNLRTRVADDSDRQAGKPAPQVEAEA